MAQDFPQSVLFCCDHNSIRSPMAEGLMKKFYGHRAYVQSAGVKSELEIDGFAVAVCAEMGVELERHRVRSFDEMEQWGDDISGFDLIVALSPASQRRALVRLPSGRYVKVQVGDRMDGGRVSAIERDTLRYTKGGGTAILRMPSG